MTTALDECACSHFRRHADPFGPTTRRHRRIDHRARLRDTTVADIVRHARTSKRTFYEQFASKEDCLIELLRRNNEDLITDIRQCRQPGGGLETRSARRSAHTSTTSGRGRRSR